MLNIGEPVNGAEVESVSSSSILIRSLESSSVTAWTIPGESSDTVSIRYGTPDLPAVLSRVLITSTCRSSVKLCPVRSATDRSSPETSIITANSPPRTAILLSSILHPDLSMTVVISSTIPIRSRPIALTTAYVSCIPLLQRCHCLRFYSVNIRCQLSRDKLYFIPLSIVKTFMSPVHSMTSIKKRFEDTFFLNFHNPP